MVSGEDPDQPEEEGDKPNFDEIEGDGGPIPDPFVDSTEALPDEVSVKIRALRVETDRGMAAQAPQVKAPRRPTSAAAQTAGAKKASAGLGLKGGVKKPTRR